MGTRVSAAVLVLASATAAQGTPASAGVDVQSYALRVTLRDGDLLVAADIHATGAVPDRWPLELASELRVVSASAGGKDVPFTREGDQVVLDTSAITAGANGFDVTVTVEGSPLEEQKSRGFVRSAFRPDVVYVRSQHAWYPRAPGDPARVRTEVDAKAGWQVRTAGACSGPTADGERAHWTFATAQDVERIGLAAGPWTVRTAGELDALVTPAHADSAASLLALAREALEFHAADLGPSGHGRFAVVEMPREFGVGSGYSEAGYILIGPGAFEAGAQTDWVPGFFAHEIAHQWWGQSGRFTDFASEALAEYSALRFSRERRGAKAAAQMRRKAIAAVVKSARAGKETPLAAIRGWGGGMDPGVYRVHAYDKAMVLLAMVEQAVGDAAMNRVLRRLLERARREPVGWRDLRDALAGAGSGAKAVVEQWEAPGIPELRAEHAVRRAGSKFVVTGKLAQSGTDRPFRMTVTVAAICGAQRVTTDVKLDRAEASFKLETPAEPEAIVVDPDWLVLAARPDAAGADKAKVFDAAFQVVNDQSQADPQRLAETIAALEGLLRAGAVSGGEEAVCHTGIGHCRFRQGKLDEAVTEFETALRLGAGGPFHRGWVNLRLGNIADLRGDREQALAHYRKTIDATGSSKAAVARAKQFVERKYRGYAQDG